MGEVASWLEVSAVQPTWYLSESGVLTKRSGERKGGGPGEGKRKFLIRRTILFLCYNRRDLNTFQTILPGLYPKR